MKNEAKKTDERARAIFLNGFEKEYAAFNDGPISNRSINDLRAYQRSVGYSNQYGESRINSLISDMNIREAMLRPPQTLYLREGTIIPISQAQEQIEETIRMETQKQQTELQLPIPIPAKPKNITLFSFLEI